MTKTRTKTPRYWATRERTAIIAKIRRMPGVMTNKAKLINADTLIEWLHGRDERFTKRKGGL
jgi:hypothetical protein